MLEADMAMLLKGARAAPIKATIKIIIGCNRTVL
jgi:hypothetical protein